MLFLQTTNSAGALRINYDEIIVCTGWPFNKPKHNSSRFPSSCLYWRSAGQVLDDFGWLNSIL